MPRSRKVEAFTLRQMTLITLGQSKILSPSQNRGFAISDGDVEYTTEQIRAHFSTRKAHPRHWLELRKISPREITLRFPAVLTKPQYHCARFILAGEFNAPFLQILCPSVADSFVTWEVARSGNYQTRLHRVQKRSGQTLRNDSDL